jgi:hypothetical protein
MSLTMHAASAPVLVRMLGNMLNWLEMAREHATAKGFDSTVYLGLRLAPDMLPLSRQIQIASDAAKSCMARLAGQPVPSWEDKEATLEELMERIRRTIAYVESVPPEALEGSETRQIEVPRRQGEPRRFSGADFLRHFALANFYFHVTTCYALLRHAGVSLGKADYLGAV